MNVQFTLEFSGDEDAFISDGASHKMVIKEINGSYHCTMVPRKPESIVSKDFSSQMGSAAHYVSITHPDNAQSEIVITPNKLKFFFTDSKGNQVPLEKLGSYDPKTDQFNFPEAKNSQVDTAE